MTERGRDDEDRAGPLASGRETDGFAAIVTRTTPRLYRMAARILGDAAEAEDVLQDSFLRAFDALESGRFDRRAEVDTWLYRIVANASLDALRARRRRRARVDLDPEGVDEAASVDERGRLVARAALREIDAWLGELPPDQRTAIVLKEIEGLSSSEVAAVMKSSVGAVEQRLVRARAALRRRSGEGDA